MAPIIQLDGQIQKNLLRYGVSYISLVLVCHPSPKFSGNLGSMHMFLMVFNIAVDRSTSVVQCLAVAT